MIALSLFKGATKSKELAVPKAAAKIESGELAANGSLAESNISMFCDAFWEKNAQAAKFPKRN